MPDPIESINQIAGVKDPGLLTVTNLLNKAITAAASGTAGLVQNVGVQILQGFQDLGAGILPNLELKLKDFTVFGSIT